MPRFPSAEWAKAFQEALNGNPEYGEAAQAWEGDISLFVSADPEAPDGEGVHLDLFHGQCRSATYARGKLEPAAEFTYQGSRGDWGKLLRGEIDPVDAVLGGTFRLRGNPAKALRFTRAAKVLVETAVSIPR